MEGEVKAEKSESEKLVERAENAARLLKAENDRQEQLLARAALGGQSLAGQPAPVQKTPDELQKERINAALKGTGLSI